MDSSLYNAASQGQVDVLRQHIDQLEIQTTANRNTALHVATQFGQLQCAAAILDACPSLLRRANIRGETPLHMAAREGYDDIVKVLIECAKKREQLFESGLGGEAKKMLRTMNVDKDTALHMAVRNCHLQPTNCLKVVRLLTREDPEFQHPANNAKETPLYLAAERGIHGVAIVVTLLKTCRSPTYGGPGGRTALHAATLKDFSGQSTKQLLEWKRDLINQADVYGWIPLHYAACNGNEKGVKELLAIDKSGVYVTTTNKDGLDTALHIAAAHGHFAVIEELLSYTPDCWEMVNSKGQNIFHIAVDMNRESVIRFILRQSWLRHLINQKDNEGSTPLHLLIASDCKVDGLWNYEKADQHAFNEENMTPVDLVWSNFKEARMSTFAATYVMDDTFMDSVEIDGGRNIACHAPDYLAKLKRALTHEKEKRKIREKEERKTQNEARSQSVKIFKEHATIVCQTLVVVAALIATITFAATFAIPGGYEGNQGRDQGMAVLARVAAFKAFVITNTIAVVCSVTSIFVCLTAFRFIYGKNRDDDVYVRYRDDVYVRYGVAMILILVAMFAMLLALITAAFAVLPHSTTLAISTCIIACIPFIVSLYELKNVIVLIYSDD